MAASVFSRFLLNRLSERSKWYTVGKISLMHIFFISITFSNSLRFNSRFKFTKFWNSVFQKNSNFWNYFGSTFWTVCRNEVCDTPLESYERGATFICCNVFEIPYGFKLILKIVRMTTGGSSRFSWIFLQTAGRNDLNYSDKWFEKIYRKTTAATRCPPHDF